MPVDQALTIFGLSPKALGQKSFIHKRYRELAKKWHPDKTGDKDKMVLINLAYEVLKDAKPQKAMKFKGAPIKPETGRGKSNLYQDLMKSGFFGKGSKVGVYA